MSRFPLQRPQCHCVALKCVMKASMNPNALYTRAEIEEIVKMVRLSLYNQAMFCGAQAIRQQLDKEGVRPLPSLRTINRILRRHGLTYGRTGHYE